MGAARGGGERGALSRQNEGPTPQDGWAKNVIPLSCTRIDIMTITYIRHFGIVILVSPQRLTR
eukprot:3853524-Pyramimonas_sp.AAC.1